MTSVIYSETRTIAKTNRGQNFFTFRRGNRPRGSNANMTVVPYNDYLFWQLYCVLLIVPVNREVCKLFTKGRKRSQLYKSLTLWVTEHQSSVCDTKQFVVSLIRYSYLYNIFIIKIGFFPISYQQFNMNVKTIIALFAVVTLFQLSNCK